MNNAFKQSMALVGALLLADCGSGYGGGANSMAPPPSEFGRIDLGATPPLLN